MRFLAAFEKVDLRKAQYVPGEVAENPEKSIETGVRKAGAALDMLVRQFSQPLACLRELVQNSIDAGSNQVEVELCRVDKGKLCLSVRDTGEGMTRAIIETQLTRLFASAKDGDLTKVGKFGIGFVSVFSLKPLAVVVDTGRNGESWRILFHPDKTYELLRLPEKVEGTLVRLYLNPGKTGFEQKLTRVEETLCYWCKHCRVEVTFNGKLISRPFSLELQNQVFHQQPGTRMCLALTGQRENFAGFYNQGLTLLEGQCSPLPFLSFKVDSRYFEHTLTRDNVIENEDYAKALSLIRETVVHRLAPELYQRLREGREQWAFLDSLRELEVDLSEAALFADLHGQFWSLKQLQAARVYHQAHRDALSEALHDPGRGRLVLSWGPGLEWLSAHGLECPAPNSQWGFCQAVGQAGLEKVLAFCQAELKVWKKPPIEVVRWLGPGPKVFLHPGAQPGLVEWADRSPPTLILLDIDHAFGQKLLELQDWSVPLAAQFLLQQYLLLLPETQRMELGPRLSEAVLKRL